MDNPAVALKPQRSLPTQTRCQAPPMSGSPAVSASHFPYSPVFAHARKHKLTFPPWLQPLTIAQLRHFRISAGNVVMSNAIAFALNDGWLLAGLAAGLVCLA